MPKLIEITATFECERYRFENSDGDVVIGEAQLIDGATGSLDSPYVTIKGKAELDDLKHDQSYRFYGRWVNYENRRSGITEPQFHFQTFVETIPHQRAGVIAYLCRAGEGNNIGNVTATQIYERFGSDSVQLLRQHPEQVADAIKRLTVEQCTAASEWLTIRQELENCTIEINSLLDSRGFPKELPTQLIKLWGNSSAGRIKHDPFCLMRFHGVGFKKCDRLYLELGLRPSKLRRQAFCAWYAVASNSDGHTWFPAQVAASGVSGLVGAKARPVKAIKLAKKINELNPDHHGALAIIREADGTIVDSGSNVFVAEGRKAANEKKIAEIIADRSEAESVGFWPAVENIQGIDDHQREKLAECFRGSTAILGGSPGTGKTFAAARVIKTIADVIGYRSIAVAAPTGKAAVRITESMNDYGVPIQARTWHSLLGMDFSTGRFLHNENDPWDFNLIIGDESSMIDTNLMSSILRATPINCHLLLIGDVNQLPPVGHGAPLRDAINAGLPYGELTEIKRNSGGIVEACAAIRDGEPWECGDNLELIEESNPLMQITKLSEQLSFAKLQGFDPVWDCQTLVAVNEKSKLSRKEINEVLQSELNLNPAIKGTPFRIADKVVNLKNNRYPLIEDIDGQAERDATSYVANGELGKVCEVEEKYLTVKLESPYRLIRVPKGKAGKDGTGCSWDLGFALSVHKSQGSSWPIVIVMIDDYPGAKMVCDRSWVYTAISRAEKKCILIGRKSTADSMCSRNTIQKRKTFLKEWILKLKAERELVEL